MKFRIILEGDVPSTMTALHFDFHHNNDLLSLDQWDGIGLTRTNVSGDETQRSTFVLSPVHAGVIGELTFKAYLAIAEQTTLSFDNIHFDAKGVTFAPECIAVISDSGSRFNYVYTCGDGFMREVLMGNALLIKSLTPNPAKHEIQLELADGIRDAEVRIVDVLGTEVLRITSDRIDVSKLANGTYFLRVSANGTSQTKQVIISR